MGHSLRGLVANEPTCVWMECERPRLRSIGLNLGLRLIPLPDDLIDELFPGKRASIGGLYLTEPMSQFLKDASRVGPLVYMFTGYHGGVGMQAAIAFHWRMIIEPKPGAGRAINQMLEHLGVAAAGEEDAFARVGLGRFRHTEDVRGG